MKHQITRITPVQTAKVIAVLWFIITIPMMLLMSIPMMFMPGPKPPMFSGFMIMLPIIYAIFGFIFTAIGAWVYNWVASKIGGVEFDLGDANGV
jgi:hypothetical protein